MLIPILSDLFDRHLQQLYKEIELYKNEDTLWKIDKEIKNSGGNLCLHLAGNLNHFIGATIGKTSYERNREAEFSTKNIAKSRLLVMIEECRMTVLNTLSKIDEAELEKDYPLKMLDSKLTTGHFLTHLLAHLNYHLGQVNYHRRLLDA